MTFDWGKKTYLMGIVNTTPDSFSGDGLLNRKATPFGWVEDAVAKGKQMTADGADMLDVGGESTRPGAVPVALEDELARVIPVVERLSKEVTIPISIDTYKAEVARQAIAAGASMINDVTAGSDPDMFHVAAESSAHLILMHNRRGIVASGEQGNHYVGTEYADLVGDIKKELQTRIDEALAAGVSTEKIIVDPGIGFGKTIEQNIQLIQRLEELKALGYPMLVGPSRKSFVGYSLNLPVEERLEGTIAACTLCIQKGADIVRVHDVLEIKRAVELTDAVVRRRNQSCSK